MEYLPSLATIACLVLLGCISPGPNFLVVTSTAMSVSRGAGLAAGLGVALASLTWASLAVAGLAWSCNRRRGCSRRSGSRAPATSSISALKSSWARASRCRCPAGARSLHPQQAACGAGS